MQGKSSVGLGRKEVDIGFFEEFKADISRVLDGQRAELCAAVVEELRAVTAELRSDIQLVLKKLDDEREEDSEPDDTPVVHAEGDQDATGLEKAPPAAGATPAPEAAVSRSLQSSATPVSGEKPQVEPGAAADEQPDVPGEGPVVSAGLTRQRGRRTNSWKELLFGDFAWEWQHQDGRWELYPCHISRRIEQAFWRGETMRHIKSSDGRVMEIFFEDMLQLDPASERVRPVRRLAVREFPFRKYPWMWIRRHTGRLMQEITTGKPQLESLKEYKRRERVELSTTGLRTEEDDTEDIKFTGVNLDWSEFAKDRNQYLQIVTSSLPFVAASMFFTCMQAVYNLVIFNSPETASKNLLERDPGVIAIEYFFFLFFLVELIMRFMALNRASEGIRDAWFCFDFLCVILSILDLIILLPLQHLGVVDLSSTSAQAFRILRIGRVFRFIRLVRQFKDLRVVLRGFVLGMRSVLYILLLMILLVFAFSCFIQGSIDGEKLKKDYFGSLGQTMRTLMFTGIMLDDIGDLGNTFVAENEIGAMVVFFIFLLVSYFGLLNMLIGSFCNTAMQVSQQESHEAHLNHLNMNLKSLLECYLTEGTETMTRRQFQLFMKNMHVHNILRTCGTDIDALMMLEDILFPAKDSELHFNKFFCVVTRLRATAPACVSHMVCITAAIDHLCADIYKALSLSKPNPKRKKQTAVPHSFGLYGSERKVCI